MIVYLILLALSAASCVDALSNQAHTTSSPSSSSSSPSSFTIPRRPLTPPFPNGPCGGTVIEIPPSETFGVDVNLGNINLLGDLVLLPRPIHVWLPPGYTDDDDVDDIENDIQRERRTSSKGKQQHQQPKRRQRPRRHPTLYVHDGQNAMTDTDSWTGQSWRLMGAITRLADHGLLFGDGSSNNDDSSSSPLLPIVVMLPSADGDLIIPQFRRRHLEYGDINFPFSQAHTTLVAKTIKPYVDNRFRTDPRAQSTFAMGTSLGGQASLHLVLRYPDLFGGCCALSPAFGPQILDRVSNIALAGGEDNVLKDKRIYIDIGGDMGDVRVAPIDLFDHFTDVHQWNPGYFWLDTQLQDQVQSMKDALSNPSVGANLCFRQFPGARHNERAWSERIDKPLLHLFS